MLSEAGFALWAGAEAPAGWVGVAVLVAFAYDLTGSCAGTAPDDEEVVPLAMAGVSWVACCEALTGFGVAETALDMCRLVVLEKASAGVV